MVRGGGYRVRGGGGDREVVTLFVFKMGSDHINSCIITVITLLFNENMYDNIIR